MQPQCPIQVRFRGEIVGEFSADFLVEEAVIVELKTVRALEPGHQAQTLNYLRATPIQVALLLNFGPRPDHKRFVFDNARKADRADPYNLPPHFPHELD